MDLKQAVPHIRTLKREGHEPVRTSFPLPAFSLTVRAVCAECNNGWMADLENKAQALLDGPISGRSRALQRDGQAALAAWALKTALMFEQANPRDARAVPEEHYRALYEHRKPPVGVWVWMAAYTADQAGVYHHHGIAITPRPGMPEPEGCNVWSATFTVGPVAFQLLGTTLPELLAMQVRWPDAVEQLWPHRASFTWSPVPAFDDLGLERFSTYVYEGLLTRTRQVIR